MKGFIEIMTNKIMIALIIFLVLVTLLHVQQEKKAEKIEQQSQIEEKI